MDTVAKIQVKISRLKEYLIEKVDEEDWHGVADAAMDLREKQVELTIALELQDKDNSFTKAREDIENMNEHLAALSKNPKGSMNG